MNRNSFLLRAMVEQLAPLVQPKGRIAPGGYGSTPTFNPSQEVLTVPQFRDHVEDIFDARLADDQNALLTKLFTQDPDVSSAKDFYLTVANTDINVLAYNEAGELDPEGIAKALGVIEAITTVRDYSLGYQHKKPLWMIAENIRYMLLLRGSCCAELILDKKLVPSNIRLIDPISLEWHEAENGVYKPFQKPPGGGDPVSLDYPTISMTYLHQNPSLLSSYGHFAAAINTIAARQHVIATLYRILNHVGFPRMTIEVLEEVILKTAPQNVKDDATARLNYVKNILNDVSSKVGGLRPEQPFVHTDVVKVNSGGQARGAVEARVEQVIATLNEQNQAALKTMSTILGRGESGANTGSTEARVFAMATDELNNPVAAQLSELLTLGVRLQGYAGRVEVKFEKAELRPLTELEPQLSIRASRLRNDLSDGIITDIEYSLAMYRRLPNQGSPQLSGTKFLSPQQVSDGSVAAGDVSPNNDPLGRSVSPDGSEAAADSRNQ